MVSKSIVCAFILLYESYGGSVVVSHIQTLKKKLFKEKTFFGNYVHNSFEVKYLSLMLLLILNIHKGIFIMFKK